MFKRSFFVVVFFSTLFVSSASYALLPAVVWIGRGLATATVETIIVEGVTRGFAANDPYTKSRIKIPTKNIPAAFRKKGGFLNPYWMAFAIATGLAFNEDGEIEQTLTSEEYLYLTCNTVTFGPPSDDVIAPCAYSSSTSRFLEINEIVPAGDSSVAVNYGSQFGVLQAKQVYIKYFSETTWNPNFFNDDGVWRKDTGRRQVLGYVSMQPMSAGTSSQPMTDDQIAALAAAYISSDNRPDAAFMDTAGNPIPELFENAQIEPLPNLNADMLQKLADYRAGLLQTTNPDAEHYVTPEVFEQLKKLAAEQDYAQTDEGKLDALNEKIKQPLTQAQYEESNLKTETSQTSALATSLAPALDPFNQLKVDSDFVLDKVTNPAEPPSSLSFFTWSLPTGSCTGFNVDFSVGNGKLHTSKRVNEFCEFYSTVAHPLLFWFLNILTFLYVWWVWDRSVSDMAR